MLGRLFAKNSLIICFAFILVACNSSSGGNGNLGGDETLDDNNQNTPELNYSVGGMIDNLIGSGLLLQNNDGDNLLVTDSGSANFNFPTQLADGDNYDVSVATQPSNPNQICSVANGMGSITAANVANISINCITESYTVGGTVNGLAGSGLVLQNTNGDQLPIAGTNTVDFTMGLSLDDGSSYQITIATQPSSPPQICTVTNGQGALNGSNVSDVSINCVTTLPDTYSVSGTVTNLSGAGLVLQNNGSDDLPVYGTGAVNFTFNTPMLSGDGYNVSVLTQPASPNQDCSATNARGTIAGNNINNVEVNCVLRSYTVGGAISGLTGTGLILQNNEGDYLGVNSDGDFTLNTALNDGESYSVTVLTQPSSPDQVCTINNGNGSIAGSNVIGVSVSCVTDSDTTPPNVLLQPTLRPLGSATPVVVIFDETMDTNNAFYSVAGTMAGESDGGVWSSTNTTNDTLTILPANGHWAPSLERSMVINARDSSGNPAAEITLTLDVHTGTLYFVNAAAADNSGSALSPSTAVQSIQTAISIAAMPATIVVSEGMYTFDSSVSGSITLVEGVSVFGAYNANYSDRNPAIYVSTLSDIASINLNSVIYANSADITNATVVDGFTIIGTPNSENSYAVRLEDGASPTIQNSVIYAGDSNHSYGVYIWDAAPLIINNNIDGGTGYNGYGIYISFHSSPQIIGNTVYGGNVILNARGIYNGGFSTATIQGNSISGGGGSSHSEGVRNEGSTPDIYNNIIDGGNGINWSAGIYNVHVSSPVIRNNTINGGSSSGEAFGIVTRDGAAPVLQNNIIFTRIGANSFCVYENEFSINSTVDTMQNNNLFACNTAYRDAEGGCAGNADGDDDPTTCNLTETNSLLDIPGGVSDNLAEDPLLFNISGNDGDIHTMNDNDWHLSPSTPMTVIEGGLNGRDQSPEWGFTVDMDGTDRPASGTPWGLGAYEPFN